MQTFRIRLALGDHKLFAHLIIERDFESPRDAQTWACAFAEKLPDLWCSGVEITDEAPTPLIELLTARLQMHVTGSMIPCNCHVLVERAEAYLKRVRSTEAVQ